MIKREKHHLKSIENGHGDIPMSEKTEQIRCSLYRMTLVSTNELLFPRNFAVHDHAIKLLKTETL